jgi:hypothetical protein
MVKKAYFVGGLANLPSQETPPNPQTESFSSLLFPHLLLLRANKRRFTIPAAIPPTPSLFGCRFSAGDGGGPRNRRADVYRLASYLVRPRLCSLVAIVGGARVCRRGDDPWRLAFPSAIGEAVVVTA